MRIARNARGSPDDPGERASLQEVIKEVGP